MMRSERASVGGARRSVEFATIDEEPVEFSLRSSQQSDVSITIDDIDSRSSLNRNHSGSGLEIPDGIPHDLAPPDHNNNTTNPMNDPAGSSSSLQSPNQSTFISAIRRMTGIFTQSSQLQGGGGGGGGGITPQQQQQQLTPPPIAATNHHHHHHAGTLGAAHVAANNREGRRATIFARRRRSTGARSSMTTSSNSEPPGEPRAVDNTLREVRCMSRSKIAALRRVIEHPAWRGTTLFFILVLLFGPPIQAVWLAKSSDAAMDVVFSVAFVVLAAEIVTRSVVDKSYFAWIRNGGNKRDATSSSSSRGKKLWCRCNLRAGSFMFWFDTVALLTVTYKISYINPVMREPHHVLVQLNELGFPISGYHATPITVQWPLILTVGRVGLMARFIRTSVLVQISGNLYWLRYFHPKYWCCKLISKHREDLEDKQIRKSAMLSQRVLGSSSRGLDRNSDPYSVSTSGDPQAGFSRRSSSRRYSSTDMDDKFEPLREEEPVPDPPDDPKPKTIMDFFKGFKRRSSENVASVSLDGNPSKALTESILFGNSDSKDSRSHVGAAMRELTGQRIATGALVAILITVICNWGEADTTKVMTMLTLHGQTANRAFAEFSVMVARDSVVPTLFNYTRGLNETIIIYEGEYELSNGNTDDLREREILSVDVRQKGAEGYSTGFFDNSQVAIDTAKVELVTTIIILCVWVLGVASFAGPVMTLVVEPIERMVRLLSMLMKDPLGYQNTPQYRKLQQEGEEIAKKSMWTEEVLKGMETHFLMNTILRIGSLMRVGFGTAGVEIIRNNLERGRHKDVLFLSKQGGNVSCIFLFCDIRQFTDATECLQEEVFVFTNKIAAVVHSICHSYGGSANKNIGDAFLVSWLLDEAPLETEEDEDEPFGTSSYTGNLSLGNSGLYAHSNQADKALLSVVRISMALHHDDYFVEDMNPAAKNRLLSKLSKRKGPVVQMGFGLHAGRAVQGAIGSQRKLDATYISESVERAEFLESSTKTYGVPLLMSDAFCDLLDRTTRCRCRKVDQMLLLPGDVGNLSDPHEILEHGEKMSIYTFDMDIDALWRSVDDDNYSTTSNSDIEARVRHLGERRTVGAVSSLTKRRSNLVRRASFTARELPGSSKGSHRRSSFIPSRDSSQKGIKSMEEAMRIAAIELNEKPKKELVLPTGIRQYTERSWRDPDIKAVRREYVSNGVIFPKFQEGLTAYFAKDWVHAELCFKTVLTQREDGPSRCFLRRMAEHGGVPPRNFIGLTVEGG